MAKLNVTYSDKEMKVIQKEEELIRYTIEKFEMEKFPKYVSNYKQYLGYTLDRLRDIESWQTNINYPLASAIIDTEFANLFDFNYVFWILEPSFRDLLNDTFDYKSQWKIALKNMLKECLICWESFSQVWLLKKTEEYEIAFWKYKETIETKKPTITYTSVFNLFYDVTHGVNDSPFHIRRTFNTADYVSNKFAYLFKTKKNKANNIWDTNIHAYINTILNKPYNQRIRFSDYDYNPVKRINNFANIITKSYNSRKPIDTWIHFFQDELRDIDQTNFYLIDKKKTYEIVEYTSWDIYSVYIDWCLLYRGKPIIPTSIKTINWISFNEVPWGSTSNGQIDNLAHMQGILNSIWNWFLDNMKMQLSWMFAIYGNVPALWKDWKMRFEKFKWIPMTPDSRIERIELGINDFSPLNVAQFVEWLTEKRAWVNWYLLWGQSKVERVSDSINLIHDQYKSKLTPIIDSVQIMMGNVAKAWMVIYLTYFTEDELEDLKIKISKDPNWRLLINDTLLASIINDENISFKFNSLRNIEKEKKRWIIKELFMSLIQVKQFAPEQLDELFKVLLDEDFDLDTFAWFNFNKYANSIRNPEWGQIEQWDNILAEQWLMMDNLWWTWEEIVEQDITPEVDEEQYIEEELELMSF